MNNLAAENVEFEPFVVRPLGKMERSIWFCDQCSPTNIGLGSEIHGPVTDEGLRAALRWCQIRHPILRTIIRQEGKSLDLACFDPAQAPAIPLEIGEGSPEDEDEVVVAEMQPPLDPVRGTLARARLLRYGENRSFLIVVFSHVIGDGFSAVLFLQEIVNFLGRYNQQGSLPHPEPLPFPPPSEEGIPTEHRGWSGFKKLMAFQKVVGAEIKRYGTKPSPVRVETDPPLTGRRIKSRSFALTETETRALVARAKQEKVSTFSLLSAALVEAFHPLLQSTRKDDTSSGRLVSIAAPVDMRPFLTSPVKGHIGFYSSAISHLCELKESTDISKLAAHLHADLRKSFFQAKVHLHTSPLLASFFSWKWLFPSNDKGVARVAKFSGDMFKSCATSLTFLNDSISIDEDHGMTISRPRGHISPSIMGTALFCVLLYQEVLSVHLNYNEGQLSEADAELLNERFKRNLLAVGGTDSDV